MEAGNAHEANPNAILDNPNATTIGFGNNLSAADEYVDLRNNVIGRALGEANPNASVKELVIAALGIFRDQGLWVVTANADGNLVAQLVTLTEEQYNAALGNLSNVSDHLGFTQEEWQEFVNRLVNEPE